MKKVIIYSQLVQIGEAGSPIVKIGIVGTGRVSSRFPQEMKYVSGAIV